MCRSSNPSDKKVVKWLYFRACTNLGNVRSAFDDRRFANVCPELNQLTGIAAILTFPLDVEVVEAEERAESERLASEAMDEQVDTN